jgi:hypothetical protein
MDMRSINIFLGTVCLVTLIVILASGCTGSKPPLQPSQDAINAANSSAESLFTSFNTGDYQQFSGHFSDAMKRGFNESAFSDMRSQIQDKYGNYTSKTLADSFVDTPYNDFRYECKFEKGSLRIRLVMNGTELSQVDGLWFPNGI